VLGQSIRLDGDLYTIMAFRPSTTVWGGVYGLRTKFYAGTGYGQLQAAGLWFAKTLADFEINDIAALPPLFCYNS
jgi:hypothetical protein